MTRTALVLLLFARGVCAQTWTQLKPTGESPPLRTNAAAIYDPVGHRLVVFGGLISGGQINDVWALDLAENAWIKLAPSSGPNPTPRWSHNAVYDPNAHQMLVWSGRRGGTFYNDVWAFDLEQHTWRELTTAEPRPNLRYGTAAVFDPVAGQLVNFAGFTDEGRFDDTWRFDPATSIWSDISGATRPGARCLHTASYDRLGHRFVIFGGAKAGGGGEKSDEVWAFDLAGGTWKLLQPTGATPPARSGAASVYVESENRALFFGGAATAGLFNDVWALEELTPMPTVGENESWGGVKANQAP